MAMKNKGLARGQVAKILQSQFKNINKEFWGELSKFNLPKIINDLITKGISPVQAAQRFIRYSQSYIDQIKGVAKYFTVKSGAVIRVEPKMLEGENTAVRFTKKGVKQGRTKKAKYEKFEKGLGVGKKVSPVSMKLTGEMQKSLSFNKSNGVLLANHERWVFHNEGMGNLPVRRLLPTKSGEGFNRRIQQNITEALARTLRLKTGKVKRFMTIRLNIK